jgi:hypothetical protein
VGAAVTQAQPGDAVPVAGGDRVVHGGEGFGGADRVVAESLDAEQASVAEKPISRSAGRWVSRLRISKSPVSLIVVSVRSARPSWWYCLILVCPLLLLATSIINLRRLVQTSDH